ncbi:MAG TPA: FAD-binding oxidoreductase [Alphaproteobacteria bacterium]|nr:FAD-binding oxidoreductase [Alphaproteobacteria bacterium]
MMNCDFLVIGAGMAGASAAYELAELGSVILIEREDMPGYHTTGRSAAVFTEAYGNRTIRGITTASRAFYNAPPDGFGDDPLLTPRGALFIGREDQRATLQQHYEDCHALVPSVSLIDGAEACRLVPILRPDYVAGAVHEPDAMGIDVNALHQGYLHGLKSRGGTLVTDAELTGLARNGGTWDIDTRAGNYQAPVVVNAAGAWCDVVAELAGVRPVGLVPKRRTAFIFDAPEGSNSDDWPLMADIDEEFYIKPDAGRLLGSPADETPMPPQDIQPDELDIAIAVDRIEKATTVKISRILNKWAGLRSFVADKTLVAGFDAEAHGFFWLAGQGGYGIQTAPAMAVIAAALASGGDFPAHVTERGVSAADLDPARLFK